MATEDSNVITTVEVITPDDAERMLGENVNNRRMDLYHVRRLARDMGNGKWQMNGDAIRFGKSGRLLDGQHRLQACIVSGQPFRTLVVRGLDDDTQLTVDTGKTRSMGDTLTLRGETNASALSSVIRAVYITDQLGLEMFAAGRYAPTKTEMYEFYERTPQLRPLFEAALKFKSESRGVLTAPMYAALWWAFSKRDSMAAEEYFHKLATGAQLREGDPILTLRNTLQDLRSGEQSRTQAGRRRILAICVKAWNKWRVGQTSKKLRFGTAEPFPLPR